MTVNELIQHLTAYATRAPQNGHAEVLLSYAGDVLMEFGRADDIRGIMGEHGLAFFPNENGKRIATGAARKQ